MVDICNLHIQFHGSSREAVAGIDLHIEEGEAVALVGESGSGKTVTSMALSGLLDRKKVKCQGKILWYGKDLLLCPREELRKIQGKEIGVVFQEPMTSLDPLQKIGKQMEEPLLVHTKLSHKERKQKVFQVLHEVELDDEVYERYPHECSGGICQRVMIATALITQPSLLVLDEPTTALDVTTQAQILSLLSRLNQEYHLAMLLISHDLNVVRQLCTRVSVMYRGNIVEQGEMSAIFQQPRHEYTKRLLQAIPKQWKEN